MKLSDAITLRDFERACDELFDEWLGRWHGRAGARPSSGAVVLDRGEAYEVWVEAAVSDPGVIEIELSDATLVVRIPAQDAKPSVERRITFAHPVDREQATARWAEGKLAVVLPKARGRRIKIQ